MYGNLFNTVINRLQYSNDGLIDNNTCRWLYKVPPLGDILVDDMPIAVLGGGYEILFAEEQEYFQNLYEKEVEDTARDSALLGAVLNARIFGDAACYLNVLDESPKRSLAFDGSGKILRFFYTDPLFAQGTVGQDPTKMDFLLINKMTIGGKVYHPTRYKRTIHGLPLPLSFTPSAFRFTGVSLYQRIIPFLLAFYQFVDVAFARVLPKMGTLLYKQEQKDANNTVDLLQSSGIQQRTNVLQKIINSFNGVGLNSGDDLNFMGGQAGELDQMLKMLLHLISILSGYPKDFLSDKGFAGVFSEGGADALMNERYYNNFARNIFKPLFDWSNQIILDNMLTNDVLSNINFKRRSVNKPDLTKQGVINGFSFKIKNLRELTQEEEIKSKQYEMQTAKDLLGISGDFDAFQSKLIASGIFPADINFTKTVEEVNSYLNNSASIEEEPSIVNEYTEI